jgi:hypothetical protein
MGKDDITQENTKKTQKVVTLLKEEEKEFS